MSEKTCTFHQLLFTDPRDTITDECMVEEMYFSMIARQKLHILNEAASGTDLYGDPANEPIYDKTIEVPIQIKLDPEEEDLDKYGYDRKREAIFWFSRKIMHDLNVEPKVGDRIDFTFRNTIGAIVNEHLIINEISPWDFVRQSMEAYQITGACNRTHKKYQPNPPGEPAEPKELPLDVTCLKNM